MVSRATYERKTYMYNLRDLFMFEQPQESDTKSDSFATSVHVHLETDI